MTPCSYRRILVTTFVTRVPDRAFATFVYFPSLRGLVEEVLLLSSSSDSAALLGGLCGVV